MAASSSSSRAPTATHVFAARVSSRRSRRRVPPWPVELVDPVDPTEPLTGASSARCRAVTTAVPNVRPGSTVTAAPGSAATSRAFDEPKRRATQSSTGSWSTPTTSMPALATSRTSSPAPAPEDRDRPAGVARAEQGKSRKMVGQQAGVGVTTVRVRAEPFHGHAQRRPAGQHPVREHRVVEPSVVDAPTRTTLDSPTLGSTTEQHHSGPPVLTGVEQAEQLVEPGAAPGEQERHAIDDRPALLAIGHGVRAVVAQRRAVHGTAEHVIRPAHAVTSQPRSRGSVPHWPDGHRPLAQGPRVRSDGAARRGHGARCPCRRVHLRQAPCAVSYGRDAVGAGCAAGHDGRHEPRVDVEKRRTGSRTVSTTTAERTTRMRPSKAGAAHGGGGGGDDWGPVEVGGRGNRGFRRSLRTVLVSLLVVVLLLVVAVGFLVTRASSSIDRVQVDGLAAIDGPTHVLVVGSDSREDLTDEEQLELTAGYTEGIRTDTIFLLSVEDGGASVLAFPRDLWVERCDGTTGRINAAYGIGGASCLVETVSDLADVPINHYLEIDFLGFRDIVDAVGGVEVCLERPIADDFAGIDLPAGCQVLQGREALGYVRVRKIDNDLERIKRQQQFVAALAKAMVAQDVTSPVNALRLSGAVGQAVTADEDLGVLDMLELARAIQGVADGALVTSTVPVEEARIDGASVLLPTPAAAAVFEATRSGSAIGAARDILRPGDVEVVVLNGAGVEGLAGTTGDALSEAGFDVVRLGNGAPPGITTVLHPSELQDEAALLAEALPVDAVVEVDEDVAQVTLVLGADYPPEG